MHSKERWFLYWSFLCNILNIPTLFIQLISAVPFRLCHKKLTDFKTVSLFLIRTNCILYNKTNYDKTVLVIKKNLNANEKIFLSKNIFIMHLQKKFGLLQAIISYESVMRRFSLIVRYLFSSLSFAVIEIVKPVRFPFWMKGYNLLDTLQLIVWTSLWHLYHGGLSLYTVTPPVTVEVTCLIFQVRGKCKYWYDVQTSNAQPAHEFNVWS